MRGSVRVHSAERLTLTLSPEYRGEGTGVCARFARLMTNLPTKIVLFLLFTSLTLCTQTPNESMSFGG